MMGKEAAVTHISQDGGSLVISVAWTMLMFYLCSHMITETSFFFLSQLHPGQSTEWPGLMPVFCERVHV